MSTPPGGQDDSGQSGWGAPQPPQEPSQSWGQHPQPGWDQQQWGQAPPGGYAGAAPQTSGLAVGALVASILGFFCGIGFIVGVILGYSARNQIRASGGRQTGEGLAAAAIVVGWIGIGLTVLGIVLFVFVFAATVPSGFAGG